MQHNCDLQSYTRTICVYFKSIWYINIINTLDIIEAVFPHVLEAEGGHGVVLPGVPHAASQPPLLGLLVVLEVEDVVIPGHSVRLSSVRGL